MTITNTCDDHAEMVTRLKKSGESVLTAQTAEKCDLNHMAVGIAGEAGELLDAIKKHVVYGKPLDMVNIVEEMGDLEFYLEGLRQILGISREMTLEHNILKLDKLRYPNGYSDQAAIERADKQ